MSNTRSTINTLLAVFLIFFMLGAGVTLGVHSVLWVLADL